MACEALTGDMHSMRLGASPDNQLWDVDLETGVHYDHGFILPRC